MLLNGFFRDCDMEKILLRNVKIFRLFFVQFLIVGIFSSSLFAQACFCGEACPHGLQGRAKARLSFPFHTRCSETQCKSCKLEDVQSLKASNAAHSVAKLKIFNTPFFLFAFSGQFNINFIKIFSPRLNKYVNFQFSPAYLQNLSLLL